MQPLRHGAQVGDGTAGEATENDAGEIIRRTPDIVHVEIPIDIGAIGGKQFGDQRQIEAFRRNHISIEWNYSPLKPGDEIACIPIGGDKHVTSSQSAGGG